MQRKNQKDKSKIQMLKEVYSQWKELESKSRVRMRKKMNKEKQQYYDFDYTRGQYYYSYPSKHIIFASPDTQQQFFKEFIVNQTKPFFDLYHPFSQQRFSFEQDIKPLELQSFLKNVRKAFHQQISTLRIQKSLALLDKKFLPITIDLMQSEIRSFFFRYMKFDNVDFTFSKPLDQRLQKIKNTLKVKTFDEFHFSEIEKADFVIYLRMQGVRQRICYNFQIIKEIFKVSIIEKKIDIFRKYHSGRAQQIAKLEKKQIEKYQNRKSILEEYLVKNEASFFDSDQNVKNMEQHLNRLNFKNQIQKQKPYFKSNTILLQVQYIPSNQIELKKMLFQVCRFYFPSKIIDELFLFKKQHLCYRLNYFASIIFRTISESHDFTLDIKEKDIHLLRKTMKRQLQTIFTSQLQHLFNILEHQIIIIVDIDDYQLQDFTFKIPSEKQNIFKSYFKINHMVDPYTKSIINLLSVKNDKTIRQVIASYVTWVLSVSKNKLKYLSLYYCNYQNDHKTHLINLLNNRLSFGMTNHSSLDEKFASILNQKDNLDENLLKITYFMFTINSIQIKQQIDHLINASINVVLRVKNQINRLKLKHQVPFQMTKQFIDRFTQTSSNSPQYQFVTSPNQQFEPQSSDNCNMDRIFRIKKKGQERQRVQVRRMMPDNPLFQGKNILYRRAMIQSDKLLDKLHNICSYVIERRENVLNEEQFSGVVDRFHLLNKLLLLQQNYQNAKLLYMEQLLNLFQKTINPEGLTKIGKQIYKIKQQEVYYNLNSLHFQQDYKNQTQILNHKSLILKSLKEKIMKYERDEALRFRDEIKQHNHLNNTPQISSIYYSDQLAMEMQEDNIVQLPEQESLSDLSQSQLIAKSQSQFVANSSKYKSDFSAISSQYHVKTTFKQILGKNSINNKMNELNRRQEMVGKKLKRLINDSVLGGIILHQKSNYFKFAHKSLQLMSIFQQTFYTLFNQDEKQLKKIYYEQIEKFVLSYEDKEVKQKCLFNENMLHAMLSECNKAISKLVERHKATQTLDEQSFCHAQLFKSIIENKNDARLNSLRGLYTCLNLVQIHEMYYQCYSIAQETKKFIHLQLQNTIKVHSVDSNTKQIFTKLNIKSHLNQGFNQINEKIYSTFNKKSNFLLCLGENCRLSLALLNLQKSQLIYYQELLVMILENVYQYQKLQVQLHIMDSFGVYINEQILDVTGIQNKLFIRKKIAHLNERLKHVIKAKQIQELLHNPQQYLQHLNKFKMQEISNDSHMYNEMKNFQQFTNQIYVISAIFHIMSEKINKNVSQKYYVHKLYNIGKALPFLNKFIQIKSESLQIYKDIFMENYSLPSNTENSQRIVIQYDHLNNDYLNKGFSPQSLSQIKSSVQKNTARKYKEFQQTQEGFVGKYYESMGLTFECNDAKNKLTINQSKGEAYQFGQQHNIKQSLFMWLSSKILLFGTTLQNQQLLNLRMILENVSANSEIFFIDQSSKLIGYNQIAKMKIQNLNSHSITDKYIAQFLNYEGLKQKYKKFLQGLAQLDIQNEGKDIFNIIYIGCPQAFMSSKFEIPQYLKNYCFSTTNSNKIQDFLSYGYDSNPNHNISYLKGLHFNNMKSVMWNQKSLMKLKNQTYFLQQRCAVIKLAMNSHQIKMPTMKFQYCALLYRLERLKQFHSFLNISVDQKQKNEYRLFLKRIQQDILLGKQKLNPIEKYLSKFMEKIIKQKPELISIKDEIFAKIYQTKFYQELIMNKLLQSSTDSLRSQIDLSKILFNNFQQKQLMRENKIIKNTLNKVLVPKIIINPYLQSPLQIQNYFFAASLKLSYVDHFLNKLKNRAIVVQLAEGGFGFLLKVNQLDDCVQSLCKGIITFTQKQFNDRFRTFTERYSQLIIKQKKNSIQIQSLKNVVSLCRQNWGKQIKSIIYSKLNNYITTMHTKEKTYESIFTMIKSLELQIAKEFDQKYSKKISSLQQQNRSLRQQFKQFKNIMKQHSLSCMEQSKDTLYNKFKKEVEVVLNKEVIKKYQDIGQKTHQQFQQFNSTILLNRLKKQKIFYQLKISSLVEKIAQKQNKIDHLCEQLSRSQNTLQLQQYKNSKISEQIKFMHSKNIQFESLKKQLAKKDEQSALNKFKLIKINQHLQGKINRYQDKSKVQSKNIQILHQNIGHSIATQTVPPKREQPKYKIRTEQSVPIQSQNTTSQSSLWRQKWENSQRKYQILISKIVQANNSYELNRNVSKLLQKLGEIRSQCGNRSRLIDKKSFG